MRKSYLFALWVLACALLYPRGLLAADDMQTVWAQFRQHHAYHIQTIAVFDHRYLIVSEPPPHVTLEGLTAVAPKVLNQPHVFRHAIGVDGWSKDVVFEIPQMGDAQLTDLLDAMHLYLFGTTYKAEVLREPEESSGASPTVSRGTHLDLRVAAADIYRWTFAESEQFSKAGRIVAVSPRSILESGETGVFYSRNPGLVLWVISRDLDLAKRRREIRQFCVDSDLILGAISSPTRVAIVARERILPSSVLPPLRTETVELLASVRSAELAQSYERKYIFAGNFDDEHHDWAPIYLSQILIDTEYGSLLNITDQMLKSWTEAGRVRYTNFNYPDPLQGFPFGKAGMDDSPQVTYNWNTTGVGYRARIGAYPIEALNRTGALAVSYITGYDHRLAGREEIAYDYFAKLNNPDLARVVQYAALYQIFHDLKAPSLLPPPPEPPNPASPAMIELTLRILKEIEQEKLPMVFATSTDPEIVDFRKRFDDFRAGLASVKKTYGDPGVEALAARLASFRGARSPGVPGSLSAAVDSLAARGVSLVQELAEVWDVLPLAKTEYMEAWKRPESGWIRTPSIVVSHWTTVDSKGHMNVGGHNLNSELTRLRENPSLPAGSVSIKEELNTIVIEYSPSDRAKSHELVRVAARELEKPAPTRLSLRTALERTLVSTRAVVASRSEALDFQSFASSPRSFQRSLLAAQPQSEVPLTTGARFSSQSIPPRLRDVSARPGHVVILRKADGTFDLVFGGLANPVKVKSMPALVDQLLDPANLSSGPKQMQLHLAGFTPEEGSGFLKNVENQMRRQSGEDSILTGIVEKSGDVSPEVARKLDLQFDFSRATLSEPRITVIEEGPLQGGHLFEARLEVPSRVALQPSLWMKIRIFFAERLPKAVSDAMHNSIDSVLARLGNERAALKVQGRELKREILRICPTAKRFELELNDFLFTERWEHPFGGESIPQNA